MTEKQASEVEKVLLHISDARRRARSATEACAKDGASPKLLAALNDAEQRLGEVHRQLMHGTYYAAPDEPLSLAV
jgi:hypothetical protein